MQGLLLLAVLTGLFLLAAAAAITLPASALRQGNGPDYPIRIELGPLERLQARRLTSPPDEQASSEGGTEQALQDAAILEDAAATPIAPSGLNQPSAAGRETVAGVMASDFSLKPRGDAGDFDSYQVQATTGGKWTNLTLYISREGRLALARSEVRRLFPEAGRALPEGEMVTVDEFRRIGGKFAYAANTNAVSIDFDRPGDAQSDAGTF
ncbi:hypothetical protein [Tsuneonella sp. HG222]